MKNNIMVMKKAETYLISEAAKKTGVESHVLRYWEEELNLPIKRNTAGHRFYSNEDIIRFQEIKMMKEKGLQLKAIKTMLTGDEEEKHSLAMCEVEPLPKQDDKAYRLQVLLKGLISEAVLQSNQNMVEDIKDCVVKELDYQFRVMNEEQERRSLEKEKREEEHYKKMDELIRGTMVRKEKRTKKGFFKKKETI